MATYGLNKFNTFVKSLGEGVHDFSSHTIKMAFTLSEPNATLWTRFSDIPEISAAGGYQKGGYTLSATWAESGGQGKLTFPVTDITATSDNLIFRYGVIYNSTGLTTGGTNVTRSETFVHVMTGAPHGHDGGDPDYWYDYRSSGLQPGSYGSTAAYVTAVKAEAEYDMSGMGFDATTLAEHQAVVALFPRTDATHVAVQDGDWSDTATWDTGSVPNASSKVLIPQAITVTYDQNSNTSHFWVRVDGHLTFDPTIDTKLKFDTLFVSHTGHLKVGTKAAPIQDGKTANLVFADNGPINFTWDPKLNSRGVLAMGAVQVYGQWRDPYLRLASDAMSGATTVTVTERSIESDTRFANSWKTGDTLIITAQHFVSRGTSTTWATQDEERTLSSRSGNTITLSSALTYNHDAPNGHSDLKGWVANLTRNVIFSNENSNPPISERGHVMLMSKMSNIRNALFYNLGRTRKDILVTLTPTGPTSNVKGRYPLHFHKIGTEPTSNPAVVEGCAIYNSPGWGFVQHRSNAVFQYNVTYDVFGAGFVAETGDEIGSWKHNMAIKHTGLIQYPDGTNTDSKDFFSTDDHARQGDGFWFQGRVLEAMYNIAVSCFHGFIYMPRSTANLSIDPRNAEQLPIARGVPYTEPEGWTINKPPIKNFIGNMAACCKQGLHVVKSSPVQNHGVWTVLKDTTAWEVEDGIALEYTGHYSVENSRVVGTFGTRNFNSTGIHLGGSNSIDLVIIGATVDNFDVGFDLYKRYTSDVPYNPSDVGIGRILVNVSLSRIATTNYNLTTYQDQFLTSANINAGMTPYLTITPQSVPYGSAGTAWYDNNLYINGTQTDSLGVKEYAATALESMEWRADRIANLIGGGTNTGMRPGTDGWWTKADGSLWFLSHEFFSDRVTGEVFMQVIPIEFSSRLPHPTSSYRGVYDPNGNAPVTTNESFTVTLGEGQIFDVLVNDTHPDGGTLRVDYLTQPAHGKVRIRTDGRIDYIADDEFTGTDSFKYWCTNGNGHYSQGVVSLTVVQAETIKQGLIGFYDFGVVSLNTNDTFRLNFDQTNGALTVG